MPEFLNILLSVEANPVWLAVIFNSKLDYYIDSGYLQITKLKNESKF